VEIYGTNGAIQIEGETVVRWDLADPARATVERPALGRPANAGAGADPRGIAPTGHIAIIRDFIQSLDTDHPPRIDGHEGRRSLATVLTVYQAAGILPAKL
jgi:predicted dehydrogenase